MSREGIRVAAAVLGCVLGATAAPAQALPFHTNTALPLPLAESSLRAFYQHSELRSLLNNGSEIANPERLRLGVDAVVLAAPAGVARGTILIAGFPYLHKTWEQSGTRQTRSGVGDAFLLVRRDVLAKDVIAGSRRLVLFAGATFPTGATASDSGPLPPPLRLGLGAVSLSGQAVYSYVKDRFGLHAAAGYAAATASRFGVRIGDRFSYDVAAGFRISPAEFRSIRDVTLAAYLELNGSVEQPATRDGDPLADTGGHVLAVSPGVQVIPLPNWAIETSFQLPVVRQLRGIQLGPDWSLAVGARAVFYLFGR